ncbi:MAG: MFS transporter [Chloroflexi bacterium]|nr:MFS transporter [Chloroflexota bacterium]MCI0579830.1 MFS transporter [Chloroflexota bacterium]MCI0646756.1 MFS transporter [Chloroflexota bacterium]MCI0728979.1 MFS transporter [Chloroflexota bacterium]
MTSSTISSRVAPALLSRNFRLFWVGQLFSTAGTALQVVAEGWLIYDLTGSTFWLGAVGFIALLPVLPVSFLGGVLIDRFPRRKLILLTQSGLLAQAAVFAFLALSGRLLLWHVVLLYGLFGALLAIDHPARRAFLVELVGRDALANAVALNATLFNVSSLVGYALSGLLIATVGAGGAMLVNAATYLAPITALLLIRLPDVPQDQQRPPLRVALAEGLVTLWRQPAVLGAASLMAVAGGLAYPVFGLMPAFAEEVLHSDAISLGLLLAAGALGSVAGTAVVARLGAARRGRSLAVAALLLPLLVAGFAHSRQLLAAVLFLIPLGVVLLVVQSLAITLVQVHVADRVRGRVMTLYSQLHAGADTGSNLVVGALAGRLGLPLALSLGAAVALLYALAAWLALPAVRRLD